MMTSQFLVSTTLLLLAGHPTLHCPRARHDCPAAAVGVITQGFVVDDGRHEPPVVVLRELLPAHADPSGEISSADRPAYWDAVPYGQLTAWVKFNLDLNDSVPIDHVQLLLDGQPLDNARYLGGRQDPPELTEDGRLRVAYQYTLPCPAPGKHILQARFLKENLWSRLSAPLYFEVLLPERPRIIAISEIDGHPAPVGSVGLFHITRPAVKILMANVKVNDLIVAILDGIPVPASAASDSCCSTVELVGELTPGIHSLSVRTVHNPSGCNVTSEPSNEVVFHYYNEDAYLLRPRGGCPSCSLSTDPKQLIGSSDHSRDIEPGPIQPMLLGLDSAQISDVRVLESNIYAKPVAQTVVRPATWHSNLRPAAGTIRLVSFLASNPVDEAATFRDQAKGFAGDAATAVAGARADALAAHNHAVAADVAAQTAKQIQTRTDAARDQAIADATAAAVAANAAPTNTAARADAVAAKAAADAEVISAKNAAARAAKYAADADAAAKTARLRADAADQLKKEAEAAHKRADAAAQAATTRAAEAVPLFNANKITAADQKRDEAFNQRNFASQAAVEAQKKAATAAAFAKAAGDFRKSADDALASAKSELGKANLAASNAKQSASTARTAKTRADQTAIQAHIANIANDANAAAAALNDAREASASAAKSTAEAEMSAQVAKTKAAEAEAHADHIAFLVRQSKTSSDAATRWYNLAKTKADDARNAASREADNTARQREAQKQAAAAVQNRDEANRYRQLAETAHNQIVQEQTNARNSANAAKSHITNVENNANAAKSQADAAATALMDVVAADQAVRDAATHATQAAAKRDVAAATAALKQACSAQKTAQARSKDAATHQGTAGTHAAIAADLARHVQNEAIKAEAAFQRAAAECIKADDAACAAREKAKAADENAASAGRFFQLEEDLRTAKDQAELHNFQVQQTIEQAGIADAVADQEESAADARIDHSVAQDRFARAQAVQSAPSPFYFASSAHFPMRQFGPQGEVIDGEGAVIYEDMKFSFDKEGYYDVLFTIGTPAVPTTIRLRFLVQPHRGGPWYTITLDPIEFLPAGSRNDAKAKVTHDYVVRGRSEILRRCYGEMGHDATIRREGTARFGYGLSGLGQSVSK
jgi:hypothetical protein